MRVIQQSGIGQSEKAIKEIIMWWRWQDTRQWTEFWASCRRSLIIFGHFPPARRDHGCPARLQTMEGGGKADDCFNNWILCWRLRKMQSNESYDDRTIVPTSEHTILESYPRDIGIIISTISFRKLKSLELRSEQLYLTSRCFRNWTSPNCGHWDFGMLAWLPVAFVDGIIKELQCPVLLAWAEKDPWIRPAEDYDKMDILHAELHGENVSEENGSVGLDVWASMQDAGHCPHDEAPDAGGHYFGSCSPFHSSKRQMKIGRSIKMAFTTLHGFW